MECMWRTPPLRQSSGGLSPSCICDHFQAWFELGPEMHFINKDDYKDGFAGILCNV